MILCFCYKPLKLTFAKIIYVLQPISITAISSISALGQAGNTIWDSYLDNTHYITKQEFNSQLAFVASLGDHTKAEIRKLQQENNKYRSLDDTVLFAIYVARKAVKHAGWNSQDNFGVNIGSSRGATDLFEQNYNKFLSENKAEPLSSPTTTLGNISSWVSHDLNTQGPEISHSITCSSAFHAVLNGIAWLHSNMSDKFLVGGSEAPLTDFTIAQMHALKIYASANDDFPCRALDASKQFNTMVLGEGASMACLETGIVPNARGIIKGIGYATEILEHNASLSTDATCFQRSMKMALDSFSASDIDVIITHTPGTIQGDKAELNAIKKVFGQNYPALTNNKWKLGHTLGASGMLSLEMAIQMLEHQQFISIPYLKNKSVSSIKNILINAVGFGGNAVSIIVTHPNC